MIIALASPRVGSSIEDGLDRVEGCLADAASRGAEIVCFPEAYLPGLRGQDFDVPAYDRPQQERVLDAASQLARAYQVTTILGMEWLAGAGLAAENELPRLTRGIDRGRGIR